MKGIELFKPYFSAANVLLLAFFIYIVFLFDWSGSTVAAWVQAVGSVAAILVASEIASRQGREQAAAARNKNLVVFDGLTQLAHRAERVGEGLPKSSITRTLGMSLSLYTGLKRNFESIDILALPVPELVDPVCTIRDSLQRLEADLGAAITEGFHEKYLSERQYATDVALIICAKSQMVAARARYEGCPSEEVPPTYKLKDVVRGLLEHSERDTNAG